MMKKLSIFLAMLFAGIQLTHAAGGTTNAQPISHFEYFNGHIGLLVKHPNMINPDACERSDWYMLSKDHPYYKEMVALIMSAHLVGQPLAFGIQGCAQSLPTVQHVLSIK